MLFRGVYYADWRDRVVATRRRARFRHFFLAVVLIVMSGTLAGYAITPYMTHAIPNGKSIQLICCILFSIQFVGWFGSWHWFIGDVWKQFHTLRVALLTLVAVGLEFVEARLLTPIWILSHPSLFLANTPVVQWIGYVSTFGLSAMLYLALFSFIPKMGVVGWKRWQGSLVGLGLLAILWFGGQFIESRVSFNKLPFSVALVQPHLRQQTNHTWEPWRGLIRLTEDSLASGDHIDLIVWPESVLTPSARSWAMDQVAISDQSESKVALLSRSGNERSFFDINSMVQYFRHQSSSSLLAGSILVNQGEENKFGLVMSVSQQRNCACLWNAHSIEGHDLLQIHDKQVLFPVMETMPSWLGSEWVREWLFSGRTVGQLTPGEQYRELILTDSKGSDYRLAVSICYESWLPWLPQYHAREPVDAICHLIYDGDFAGRSDYTETMLKTIRLRAIEIRTWQLVCSYWAGTAIIDPRGHIVAELPPAQNVLRSDRL